MTHSGIYSPDSSESAFAAETSLAADSMRIEKQVPWRSLLDRGYPHVWNPVTKRKKAMSTTAR